MTEAADFTSLSPIDIWLLNLLTLSVPVLKCNGVIIKSYYLFVNLMLSFKFGVVWRNAGCKWLLFLMD
jgi:hypothetical protein